MGQMVQPQLGRERIYLEEFESDIEVEYFIGGTTEAINTVITQARVCWDDREMDEVEIQVFHLVDKLTEQLNKNAILMAS